MMNYKTLFEKLRLKPPVGWCVIHHGTGVYLWPLNIRAFRGQSENPLLKDWELLFECHRIPKSGNFRLIARANSKGPNFDSFCVASRAARCTPPQPRGHKSTKGVALWQISILLTQAGVTVEDDAARDVRQFLAHPDEKLIAFLGRLALLG